MAKSEGKSRTLTFLIIIILCVWAAVVGGYLANQRRETSASPAVKPKSPQKPGIGQRDVKWDKERWTGIYQGNQKIGYAVSRVAAFGTGYRLWNVSRIRLELLNQTQDISLDVQAKVDDRYSIDEVEFEAKSGYMEFRARGVRVGKDLDLTINTGGKEINHRLHFDEPPKMGEDWIMRESLADAAPGDSIQFSFFEPMSQKSLPMRVKAVAEEEVEIESKKYDCLKLEITMAGQSQWAWISRDGELVKEYHPGTGFTTLMEDRDKALDVDWEAAGHVDIISRLMVPSSSVINKPRSVGLLKVELQEAPLEGLELSFPPRQTVAGRKVTVTMERAIPAIGYALPIAESLPDKAEKMKKWLEPTPFIQSGDEKIIEAARAAAGQSQDAVTAVDQIILWMDREIEPSLVTSIPSALEVLERKKGACKEHSILFVAMARSLGIPARMAAGIVYSDEQIIDGFYYHAWAEVYLADADGHGQWVAVDPTFHQNPADATHLRLILGDMEDMISLMNVVGVLKVKVEDYK